MDLPLGVPSQLVERRPDVRAAEAQLHSATAQVGVAIANMLPQLTITGNLGSSATLMSDLFKPGTGFWTIGADATQTLFQGGTLLHRKRAADAALDQAAATYRATVLTAFQNVADALHALDADADALEAASRAAVAAEKSLGVARQQLELGSVSYLALLNARARLSAGGGVAVRRPAPIDMRIPPPCSRPSADPSRPWHTSSPIEPSRTRAESNMCGIVGVVAERNAVPILMEGLRRLEYRGYDSAGLAVLTQEHQLARLRTVGKVKALEDALAAAPIAGHVGIAHTRWATHGVPTTRNAHPHVSRDGIAIVHNGIIENHEALKAGLIDLGYTFSSETDTEVIAHRIHHHLSSCRQPL